MANTYELISSTTAGSAIALIEFTSIPGTYTDLVLKLSARHDVNNDNSKQQLLDFNSSGSTKELSTMRYDGSNVNGFLEAAGQLNGYITGGTATANVFGFWELYLPSYANTNFTKSYVVDFGTENNAAAQQVGIVAGAWPSSTAITSIKLSTSGGNYVAGTSAYLYGIKNS
jgi:hypothetical protein